MFSACFRACLEKMGEMEHTDSMVRRFVDHTPGPWRNLALGWEEGNREPTGLEPHSASDHIPGGMEITLAIG